MNTRKIKPKNLWTPEGEKTATILSLTNFENYNFDGGGGMVTYKLLGMESPGKSTDENGNLIDMPPAAKEYFKGNVLIPADIVAQWGASDEIIWSFVAAFLKIEFD